MQSHQPRRARFGPDLRSTAIVTLLVAIASSGTLHAQTSGEPPQSSARPERSADDDGRFHAVLGSFITAAGTDVAVSMYQIGRGTAREAGFGAWWQDSPVAFAATKSVLTALFAYQLQRPHRTRPKTAFILGIAGTSVEAMLIARSARLKPPVQ